MANISKLKLPNGSEYDLKVYTDHIAPMMSKTFTGVVGTANTDVDCTFFFGTVRPISYYDIWKIKYRVYVRITGTASTYNQYAQARSEATWFGSENTYQAFHHFNQIHNTSYRPTYYHTLYNLKKAGYDAGLGHALGIGLRYSWNAYNSSYPREIVIQILECENCQFTFLNSMIKWTSLPSFNTTNYQTYRQIDFASNGLQETSDSNDPNYQNRIYYSNPGLYAYADGGRYTLTFTKNSNYVLPITATDNKYNGEAKTYTTESFDPFGEIYYRNGSAITANAQIANANLYRQILVDARYSFTGVTSSASTSVIQANDPIYIACIIQEDGSAKLYQTPLATQIPLVENGLSYILLGFAYSSYQFELLLNHPVYQFKNGQIIKLNPYVDGALIKNIPVNSSKTKSGNIVSFYDSKGNVLVRDLKVDLEPVQDLHGYDNPWPAGGGKNLFDESIADAPYYVKSDGTFTNRKTDTRPTAMIQVQVYNGSTLVNYATTSGTYPNRTIGTITIDSAVTRLIIKHNGSSLDLPINIPWTAQGTFTISCLVPSNDPTTVGGLVIKDIQVEEGSTATDYAPYSNICPISGRDSVTVTRTGVNLFDKTTAVVGYISDNDGTLNPMSPYKCTDYIRVNGGNSYYIKSEQARGMWGAWYDKNKGYISSATGYANTVVTAPSNAAFVRLTVLTGNSGNVDTFAFNYPSTDHDYHAYQGQSIEIQLGQTVYGGTLDVTTGVLTVTKKRLTTTWGAMGNQVDRGSGYLSRNIYVDDILVSRQNDAICNLLIFRNDSSATPHFSISQSKYFVAFMQSNTPDATALELAYELATPITVQLTAQQLTTLLGQNNIWANTGDTTVKYISTINGVYIPEASNNEPGLMSVQDKAKVDNINNHVIASKTQPLNQQAGDIWLVISSSS